MNPPSFTGSSTIEDPENFIEELQKEEKLRDREEFKNKRAKTGNESGQQKSNAKRSSFQQKQKGPALSSASAPAPKNKIAPPDRVAPRGATSNTSGGSNHLYAITSRQEQEDSPYVVTVDCRTRVVKFQFPNDPALKWKKQFSSA
uniref:Gag-pol polyprotein n=1 Tax=Solanum tuberosum TaxID=4113 RepID=M1DAU2_SOLTU